MKQSIRDIIRSSILLILERFERENEVYPFVNTKFDIVTGQDFGNKAEAFKGHDCIYSWIQGRGLESLAKHAEYMDIHQEPALAERLRRMMAIVAGKMEQLRALHAGRLPFAMHQDGTPFFPQEKSDANYSDLFYSKGLFATGRVLGKEEWMRKGRALFLSTLDAIRRGDFRTDQKSFDPKNQVAFVSGKYPQGPRMIALGGIADFLFAEPEEPIWAEFAEEFIRFILAHHVNQGTTPELQPYDFIESLDAEGHPWKDGEILFCDPGHALEFTGLAAKCLLILKRQERQSALIQEALHALPPLFCHVFDYGFNPTAGGIVKGFDLMTRCPTNSDMPWWSLPETTRAGFLLAALSPIEQLPLTQRAERAFGAFAKGFLQMNGFACQTRDANGHIVNVIPALPDADPGYHTNLSLMDVESTWGISNC